MALVVPTAAVALQGLQHLGPGVRAVWLGALLMAAVIVVAGLVTGCDGRQLLTDLLEAVPKGLGALLLALLLALAGDRAGVEPRHRYLACRPNGLGLGDRRGALHVALAHRAALLVAVSGALHTCAHPGPNMLLLHASRTCYAVSKLQQG